jgi:midasin (ATPase involved in ribosome maturation)
MQGFYLRARPLHPRSLDDEFVITPTVSHRLRDLCRAVASERLPVLVEGPTSSGKTTLVSYVAARLGNKLVRVNNHEHTDLREYVGTYISDQRGRLRYRDAVLVEAVRHGHWPVLDELNLAAMEVLEALNRLLDDNRERIVPETRERIVAHPGIEPSLRPSWRALCS